MWGATAPRASMRGRLPSDGNVLRCAGPHAAARSRHTVVVMSKVTSSKVSSRKNTSTLSFLPDRCVKISSADGSLRSGAQRCGRRCSQRARLTCALLPCSRNPGNTPGRHADPPDPGPCRRRRTVRRGPALVERLRAAHVASAAARTTSSLPPGVPHAAAGPSRTAPCTYSLISPMKSFAEGARRKEGLGRAVGLG